MIRFLKLISLYDNLMTIHFGTPVEVFILFRMYYQTPPLYDIDAKQHIPVVRTQDFLDKKKPTILLVGSKVGVLLLVNNRVLLFEYLNSLDVV